MERCFDLTLTEGIVFRATHDNSVLCKFGNSILNHIELHLAPNDVRAAYPAGEHNVLLEMEAADWPIEYREIPSTQDVELAVAQLIFEVERELGFGQ